MACLITILALYLVHSVSNSKLFGLGLSDVSTPRHADLFTTSGIGGSVLFSARARTSIRLLCYYHRDRFLKSARCFALCKCKIWL
ncbi:hypothetical protein AMELA_G00141750 [Ameiurus melas]|uniref:Secreted protein n=1 Tax=Ameiurus melas TaxID=219545 RepID=A0A7J6APM6_AMEME|nr:hypothetical protein AMELA_G00141750 [Ameiurus melas]